MTRIDPFGGSRHWLDLTRLLTAVLMVGLVMTTGCRQERSALDYFPLDSGARWLYQIDILQSFAPERSMRDMVLNLDPVDFFDQGTQYQLTPQIHSSGMIYYYYSGTNGILRLGMQKPGEDGIVFDSGTHTVLAESLKVGERWKNHTGTRLILKRPPLIRYPLDAEGVTHTILFSLDYRILSLDVTLRTRAGIFQDCLKVRAHNQILVPRDHNPLADPIRIDVESTQWYAPGVGLIRWVYRERTKTEVFGDNVMTVELEEFEPSSWF